MVKPRGSAAHSQFTLKVRRPPPCPLSGLIDVGPADVIRHVLSANRSGWPRPALLLQLGGLTLAFSHDGSDTDATSVDSQGLRVRE